MNLNIARTEPAVARANGIELTYDTFGDSEGTAGGADHGPGNADDRLGRRVLRRIGCTRFSRHPLRQPRHRAVHQARKPGSAQRAAIVAGALCGPADESRLHAQRHGARRGRAARRARHRHGTRRRRIDGRRHRADAGHRAPASPAQPVLDHGHQRRSVIAATQARGAATADDADAHRPGGLLLDIMCRP